MRTTAVVDPVAWAVDVFQSVCLSRERAVQKRLNGSSFCLGWRLLEIQNHRIRRFNAAFAKLLWQFVLYSISFAFVQSMTQVLRHSEAVAATRWRHRTAGSSCPRAVVATGSDAQRQNGSRHRRQIAIRAWVQQVEVGNVFFFIAICHNYHGTYATWQFRLLRLLCVI